MRKDLDVLTRIAWLYYKENLTQQQISSHLHLSRTKIVRLLQQARRQGVIHFHISSPLGNVLSLEQELIRTFHLHDSMIIPTSPGGDIRRSLGQAAAQYLERHAAESHLLALGWGTTISQIAPFVTPDAFRRIRIVNLIGGLTTAYYLNPYEIGGQFSSLCQGQCYYIHAPAVAATEELCRSFKSERTVRQALELARSATHYLVGIGQAGAGATLVKTGFVRREEAIRLQARGAVGNILAQFFDRRGRKIDCALHRRIIAMPLEELHTMSPVIGVAGGPEKQLPVLGALRGRLVNALITDEDTAKAVLALHRGHEPVTPVATRTNVQTSQI